MSYITRFVLCVAILFPLFGFCGDALTATASGDVRLNGRPLVRSSAVLVGDQLETVADSAVVLHGKGFSVQIGSSASSAVENGALLLKAGDLHAKGMVNIRAGIVTAYGDSTDTRFTLSHSSGIVSVKVTAGSVVVRRWNERVVLSRGESRTFEDDGNAAPAAKRNHKKILVAVGAATAAGIGSAIAVHLKDHTPDGISSSGFTTNQRP